MAGYTRQSIADIINGAEITAPPLNAEFNQLSTAFNASTGHSHDGTTGNAPKIDLTTSVTGYLPAVHGGVGGKNNLSATTTPLVTDDNTSGYAPGSIWENTTTGRVYICVGNTTGAAVWRELVQVENGNAILPATHDAIDIGSVSVRYQDLFLSGGIAASGNVTIGGTATLPTVNIDGGSIDGTTIGAATPAAVSATTLSTSGNTTIGGTLGVTGTSSFTGAISAGSLTTTGNSTHATVDINGGAIDGTAIGASSASTGAFTTLTASNATLTTADINGGTIDGADIGVTSRGAGNFTTVNANAGITGNLTGNVTGNVNGAVTGNVTGNITSSGTSTFATVDINGGAIDGTAIGAASASTVRGTTITATTGFTGNLTGNVTGNTTGTHTGNVTATTGTTTLNNLTVNGAIDVTNAVVQNVATPTIGTDAANKSYVDAQIAATIDAAPGTLDTLNELAAALGDDPNFATTVSNSIATKVSKAGDSMTGNLSMGGNKVTGLADPTVGTDAVTKNYVDTVYGSVSSAAASATAAANSASAAEADRILVQSVYDTFDDRYLGAKASDPTLDNDGNALLTGALYFNTSNNITKVYNGSEWQAASSSIEGIKQDFLYVATAAQTVFSGADSNGNTLVVDQVGLVAVYMNGVRLIKDTDYTVSAPSNSVTLISGAASGDRIEVEVFGNFAGQSGAAVAITGGTIDGTVIGGTTPAAVTGTTGTFSGNLTVDTNTLYVDATNNRVGVGTSSPAVPLDVIGNAYVSGTFYPDSIGSYSGDLPIDIAGNSFIVTASGAERMRVNSSGNVGINTSSPTQPLDVNGNVNVAANISSSADSYIYSYAGGSVGAVRSGFQLAGSTNTLVAYTNSTERLRIDSSGNVGIGTSSPSVPLHVVNASTPRVYLGSDASKFSGLIYSAGTTYGSVAIRGQGNDTGTVLHVDRDNSQVRFDTSGSERMRITSSGTVGIGTSSPSYNLVVSNGGAEGLEIGPGYVGGKNLFQNYNRSTSAYVSEVHYASEYIYNVGGTERMRIDSSGNLLVGTSASENARIYVVNGSSSYAFWSYSDTTADVANAIFRHARASGGTVATQLYFMNSAGGGTGSITSTGSSTAYNTSSDYRLKEDWQPITGASDRVLALNPVNFAWKADGTRVDGFLAHEAQEVVPEAVHGEKDAVDADGNPVYQGIDQSKLVPLLTAALQEALGKIEALEARLTAANL